MNSIKYIYFFMLTQEYWRLSPFFLSSLTVFYFNLQFLKKKNFDNDYIIKTILFNCVNDDIP